MTHQPFHHGNLRAVLLDQAEQTLRGGGVDDLSLRELARRAGVSHGAPRSHFVDRQALLDALAERGFHRLTEEIDAAATPYPDDLVGRLRAVAGAYVRFAVTDASLLELMFSTKGTAAPAEVQAAAARFFSTFGEMFSVDFRAGRFRSTDPDRTKLLFVAVLQGVASLTASRRITEDQGAELVHEAIALLVPDGSGD